MNQPSAKTRPFVAGILVVALLAGVCVTVILRQAHKDQAKSMAVAENIASDFFLSLAALDVEENERAARILTEAVESEPREPALWANLAVAQMRLRDLQGSRESLQQALNMADDSRELARLRAEVLEQSGDIESAIKQLRQLHSIWPDNIAVTYSLATLLGRIRSEDAEAERLSLLSDILRRAPGNLRVRCEQARVAAKIGRIHELLASLDSLKRDRGLWLDSANDELSRAERATQAGDFRTAALSLTIFENLQKPNPEYQKSLEQLGVDSLGAIGTPVRSFLRLNLPLVEVADADKHLTFEFQRVNEAASEPELIVAIEQSREPKTVLVSLFEASVQVGNSTVSIPSLASEANSASIGAADLNFDFRQDVMLVGEGGCLIFLSQKDGSYLPHATQIDEFHQPWRSIWSADIDADGDVDLLLSDHVSPLLWIRNNGDMTFTAMSEFIAAQNVVDVQADDLDADGDLDLATLDTGGAVSVWQNERSGDYVRTQLPSDNRRIGLAVADVDRNGTFDLISLARTGELLAAIRNADGSWSESPLLRGSLSESSLANALAGDAFLTAADVDNNGGVDLVASLGFESGIWLSTPSQSWMRVADAPEMHIASVTDVNGDGLLDLTGRSEVGGQVCINLSEAGYQWHAIEPTANRAAGDKRINSFGIGGRIDIRAGYFAQAAAIRSPRVHFGLGRHKQVDVARIVWPNGTVQAEFDLTSGQQTVANQRLKGSCPWVFAFDGHQFRFVKDFLWRSPLGLRINAQTTAGIVQTEDWIKIAGSHLMSVNGRYSLRITGELWETLFFDHVSLLAVDHPSDLEAFVDERFVPNQTPDNRVLVTSQTQPLPTVSDHLGNRLNANVQHIDGVFADGFELGEYQGVAEEHWIAFELPKDIPPDRPVMIVGNGWIYPTDSSLNVATGQQHSIQPYGLVLEKKEATGAWRLIRDNLGFPAGKNKDVIIEIPSRFVIAGHEYRLRTNMEIYWDRLAWCHERDDVDPQVTRLPVQSADLRHRGFSKLMPTDRRRPDTPIYEVNSTQQRWSDLEGFHTRFGDVMELLDNVDDRYVIMNAGDELLLEFAALSDVPAGWRRDFVLIGDGWVKDGDLNTAFSRWVRPLPSHDDHEYAGPRLPLQDDPVFVRNRSDWFTFHTRYVGPRPFQRGLWPGPKASTLRRLK